MAAAPADRSSDGGPGARTCVRHPSRPTWVSCGRCGRPFCPDCLVYTPAGQRCYECAGVRRDWAQRVLLDRALRAGGLIALGAGIASFAGLFGLLIGAGIGNAAAQALGPSLNRRTRAMVYTVALATLLGGSMVGWTVGTLVRVLIRASGAGVLPPILEILIAVPLALVLNPVGNVIFWLYVAVAGALGYRQLR